jgi:hypothetical protein
MKHIKRFNESFEHIPYVIKTVEQMLYQIKDFEFDTKVNFEDQKELIIQIKKDSYDIKVFESGDIRETLIEINNYLTQGEDFQLKEILVTTIPISSESISFEQLINRRILLLDCNLIYKLKQRKSLQFLKDLIA